MPNRSRGTLVPGAEVRMVAVVNHMKLARRVPDEVFERMQRELMVEAGRIAGFHDAVCIRIGDEHVIMVVQCETAEAMEAVHRDVGGPWIGTHLRPFVESVDRKVGVVAARTE